jgi:hypothetical protein
MQAHSLKFLAIISVVSAMAAFSMLTDQPASAQRTSNDFRITERTTMSGRTFESTTMIKGARERSEQNMGAAMGMDVNMVNITQCDNRRTIQINDRSRKYMISPMDSDDATAGGPRPSASASGGSGPVERGGVVTYTTNTTDTGERKQMFGFTARHLKSSMSMEASPDACAKDKMRIERDGWYIDLTVEFSCATDRVRQMGMRPPRAGCQDRVVFRHSGGGKLGYPVQETTTMYGPNGDATFTITKEVIDLSRQPLDAALFDIPAGYTEARSQQEMFGMPSMDEMMKAARQQQQQTSGENPSTPSMTGNESGAPRGVKIGVVQFNNKANASVSPDELRDRLIGEISGAGIEAIPLNASSLSEAQTEAKVKQCDYILLTDISTLKTASAGKKIGGLLGRAAGVDTGGAGKSEAKFDYKLYPAGGSSPKLQSSANAKEDNQEASVNSVLSSEAQAVIAAARKN